MHYNKKDFSWIARGMYHLPEWLNYLLIGTAIGLLVMAAPVFVSAWFFLVTIPTGLVASCYFAAKLNDRDNMITRQQEDLRESLGVYDPDYVETLQTWTQYYLMGCYDDNGPCPHHKAASKRYEAAVLDWNHQVKKWEKKDFTEEKEQIRKYNKSLHLESIWNNYSGESKYLNRIEQLQYRMEKPSPPKDPRKDLPCKELDEKTRKNRFPGLSEHLQALESLGEDRSVLVPGVDI